MKRPKPCFSFLSLNNSFLLLFIFSSSSSDTTPEKKPKTPAEINENMSDSKTSTSQQNSSVANDDSAPLSSDEEHEPNKVYIPRYRVERLGARQTQTIPGMGIYSDSSDSESSSSDSEIISTSSFVRYHPH